MRLRPAAQRRSRARWEKTAAGSVTSHGDGSILLSKGGLAMTGTARTLLLVLPWAGLAIHSLAADPASPGTIDRQRLERAAIAGAAAVAPSGVTGSVAGCPAMAASLDDGALVVAESWIECSAVDANGPTSLAPAGLTLSGGQAALLTNGSLANANPPNNSTGISRDNGTSARGAFDVSILRLDLMIPTGMNCLGFDVVFASEEYPEYVGSFNDGFLAELDVSDWSMAGNLITAPNNFAVDGSGRLFAASEANFTVTSTLTEYDGATGAIHVQTAITPGAHSLYLSIFDSGDRLYDTAAWVDHLAATDVTDGSCGAAPNQAPQAFGNFYVTPGVTQLVVGAPGVLGNDLDSDGDTLQASVVSGPAWGTLILQTDGSFTYDPAASFTGGNVSFVYQAADGNGGTDNATVQIQIGMPGMFYSLTPCRTMDTRGGAPIGGPALTHGATRIVNLHGLCGIPATAVAVSVNVTLVSPTGFGQLQAYRGNAAGPSGTTTVAFKPSDNRANNAVLPLASNKNGTLAMLLEIPGGGSADVIVDVNGYFE